MRALTKPIANLPWYDFPELERHTDALWTGIARHMSAHGLQAPAQIQRDGEYDAQWRQPELLFSQACGYDVLHDHAAFLRVVATPRYRAAGCAGANYRSAIVVREKHRADSLSDLRGSTVVVNDPTSHSGTNALRALVAPLSRNGHFFKKVKVSGAHTESLSMLASQQADVASIDLVVWALCQRVRPRALEGLRMLTQTETAPAPPFVTSRSLSEEMLLRLRTSLLAAMADPVLKGAREELLLEGVEVLPDSIYGSLEDFESVALAHNYFELPAPRLSPLNRPGK